MTTARHLVKMGDVRFDVIAVLRPARIGKLHLCAVSLRAVIYADRSAKQQARRLVHWRAYPSYHVSRSVLRTLFVFPTPL